MTTRSLLDNWVHDVGYTNEKVHAGILQRLLLRAAPEAQRAALAAFWFDATGEHLADGPATDVSVQREAPLDGRKLRLGLLVSFRLGTQHYQLGIELKVDSRPDAQQIADEWGGIRRTHPRARVALVLLCLGTAQVCDCDLPPGVHRWSLNTLLERRELLCNLLPDDPIVAGWLESLYVEEQRRLLAQEPPVDLASTYRKWSKSGYWLGCLQQALSGCGMPALAPWHTKIHANGPVITATGSWRHRQHEGTRIRIFVEINWAGLYVKAGAAREQNEVDPRPLTKPFFDSLQAALTGGPDAVASELARFRRGEFSSILKIPLSVPRDLQRVCNFAA